ncbi:hypothetical protein HDU85_002728 [Gaertneriomyces sp. JEL0708]|nr:hypothetical protein HDU85_002728 [Gaertneriomyces sp. JEL0708]
MDSQQPEQLDTQSQSRSQHGEPLQDSQNSQSQSGSQQPSQGSQMSFDASSLPPMPPLPYGYPFDPATYSSQLSHLAQLSQLSDPNQSPQLSQLSQYPQLGIDPSHFMLNVGGMAAVSQLAGYYNGAHPPGTSVHPGSLHPGHPGMNPAVTGVHPTSLHPSSLSHATAQPHPSSSHLPGPHPPAHPPTHPNMAGAGTTKTAFPQARVKSIMKEDKEVTSVSNDAVFAATLATEMFLELLVERSWEVTQREQRKVVMYRDVSRAVVEGGDLTFLEDAIPATIPLRTALENKEKIDKAREKDTL